MGPAKWKRERPNPRFITSSALAPESRSRSRTAMRRVMACSLGSQVGIDVVEGEAGGEHEHLRVVEQLADLQRRRVLALVLGGHPGLGGLLEQLLADRMDAGIELLHGAGPLGALRGLGGQLCPQV